MPSEAEADSLWILDIQRMKQLWRDIRGVLRGAAVQAVAKLVAALLAALGAATVVDPQLGVDARNAALVQPPEAVVPRP